MKISTKVFMVIQAIALFSMLSRTVGSLFSLGACLFVGVIYFLLRNSSRFSKANTGTVVLISGLIVMGIFNFSYLIGFAIWFVIFTAIWHFIFGLDDLFGSRKRYNW